MHTLVIPKSGTLACVRLIMVTTLLYLLVCVCVQSMTKYVRRVHVPEAAHFSLKKGRWVVSGGVALSVI